MRCGEVKNLISAYVDDELDLPTTRLVSMHIKRCDECAAYFERVRKISVAFARINKPQSDPALEARLFIELKAAVERPTFAERIVRAYMPDWRMAAATGMFVLALVIYFAGGPLQFMNSTRDFAAVGTETVVEQAEEAESFWSNLLNQGKERAASISRSILGNPGEAVPESEASGTESGALQPSYGVAA